MKYLGTNLIKYVQDLYVKNYKTLMKEIQNLTQKESYIYYNIYIKCTRVYTDIINK